MTLSLELSDRKEVFFPQSASGHVFTFLCFLMVIYLKWPLNTVLKPSSVSKHTEAVCYRENTCAGEAPPGMSHSAAGCVNCMLMN